MVALLPGERQADGVIELTEGAGLKEAIDDGARLTLVRCQQTRPRFCLCKEARLPKGTGGGDQKSLDCRSSN